MSRRKAAALIAQSAAGVLLARSASGAEPMAKLELMQRAIPSSGEMLPVIGLGTWQAFDVGPSPAERKPLEEVLALFVKLGGRVVDSSPMYGRAEQVIGDIAARLGLAQSLFLATKVWTTGKQPGIDSMGEGIRLPFLGSIPPQVDRRSFRRDLHDSRHEQRAASRRQHARRHWPSSG
jgi:aryl-alcohol dehydrogenase-like predicted oxidoreductase